MTAGKFEMLMRSTSAKATAVAGSLTDGLVLTKMGHHKALMGIYSLILCNVLAKMENVVNVAASYLAQRCRREEAGAN